MTGDWQPQGLTVRLPSALDGGPPAAQQQQKTRGPQLQTALARARGRAEAGRTGVAGQQQRAREEGARRGA